MPVAFPKAVRAYLVTMPVSMGVFWECGGEVGVIIKLPNYVSLVSMEATFSTFRRDPSKTLHVTLHLQGKGNPRVIDVDCLLNPPGLLGMSVIPALLTAQHVEVYAISTERTYLGLHLLPWPHKKRRNLAAFVRDLSSPPKQDIPPEEQEISSSTAVQSESVSESLLERYLMALYDFHVQEEEVLRLQPIPSLGQSLLPLMHEQHALEEFVLSHSSLIAPLHRQGELLDTHSPFASLPRFLHFPDYPFWSEWDVSISEYWRDHIGFFCFRADYDDPHQLLKNPGGHWLYRTSKHANSWWLDIADADGIPFLRLVSRISPDGETQWDVDPTHLCPTQTCYRSDSSTLGRATVQLCDACLREARFWCQWSTDVLARYMQYSFAKSRSQSVGTPSGFVWSQRKGTDGDSVVAPLLTQNAVSGPTEAHVPPVVFPFTPNEQRPIIVTHPFLIDRYMYIQRTAQRQEAIEHASKYLWMHSAWYMTQALKYSPDESELLRVPPSDIYIELEQPHSLNDQQFAACSFLCLSRREQSVQRWQYTMIDMQGAATWKSFYEVDWAKGRGSWTLPKEYLCPQQQCHVEEMISGQSFTLCEECQQRFADSISWIVVALRMVAGDFQERVEFCENDEVLETAKKVVKDDATEQEREKTVLRRFKVIRYYDATTKRDEGPRTKRGSWMTGKPLATSEYEINPNAIIFVQIQPREHDRTYRHDRYTYMKGKKQHIDPLPRLQPMTIATFRQLPRMQRITKVYASTFDEEEDGNK